MSAAEPSPPTNAAPIASDLIGSEVPVPMQSSLGEEGGVAVGGDNLSSPSAQPPAAKRAKVTDDRFQKLESLMRWRQAGLVDSPEFKAAKHELRMGISR